MLIIFSLIVNLHPNIGVQLSEFFYSKSLPKGDAGEYIAFRISLHIFATVISMLLLIVIYIFGMSGFELDLNPIPRWKKIIFALIIVPIVWVGYPFYALSGDYFSNNLLVYIFLTALIFSGIQMIIAAIFNKPRATRR